MKTTIELAREAGGDDWGLFKDFMPEIERLVALVRADEREALGVLETDAHYIFNNPPGETSQDVRDVIEWYSAAIRNRGNT
jgi:hypothetical protein